MPLIVNDEVVDPEWVNQEFAEIKSWHEQRSQVSCCERDDEFREQAKRNVIGRILLNQEAKRSIPELTPEELEAGIKQLHKDYGGEQQFMAATGITPDNANLLRNQVSLTGKIDRLIGKTCGPEETPDDSTLQSFYESNIPRYTTEERVRAVHIFKSLRQAEDRESLFRECCDVRRKVLDGADFLEVAKEFSDKPAEEIDLGFFKRGELMDEFEFVAFSMNENEVSPVFSTYHGFHIAKVIDREPATPRPLDEIKEQVLEDYLAERRNGKLESLIEKLKSEAEISDEPDDSDN